MEAGDEGQLQLVRLGMRESSVLQEEKDANYVLWYVDDRNSFE